MRDLHILHDSSSPSPEVIAAVFAGLVFRVVAVLDANEYEYDTDRGMEGTMIGGNTERVP